VEMYTPRTNKWTTLPSMSEARQMLGAAVAADGRIFAIGGSHYGVTNLVEVYTLRTRTWTKVAPMLTAREGLAVAVGADGRIYAMGGRNDNDGFFSTVEAYD